MQLVLQIIVSIIIRLNLRFGAVQKFLDVFACIWNRVLFYYLDFLLFALSAVYFVEKSMAALLACASRIS